MSPQLWIVALRLLAIWATFHLASYYQDGLHISLSSDTFCSFSNFVLSHNIPFSTYHLFSLLFLISSEDKHYTTYRPFYLFLIIFLAGQWKFDLLRMADAFHTQGSDSSLLLNSSHYQGTDNTERSLKKWQFVFHVELQLLEIFLLPQQNVKQDRIPDTCLPSSRPG